MSIDELIESAEKKSRVHEYHADIFENGNPMRDACIKSSQDCKQLAEWFKQLKEYQTLEEQGRLIKLPKKVEETKYRECVHTRTKCHHENYKCSECPLIELLGAEFYTAIDRCYEEAYASGCLAGIELGESEAKEKLKELRGSND